MNRRKFLENTAALEALKWATESYNLLLEYAQTCEHQHCNRKSWWCVQRSWLDGIISKGIKQSWLWYLSWMEKARRWFLIIMFIYKRLYPTQKECHTVISLLKNWQQKWSNLVNDGEYKGWYRIESGGCEEIKKGIEWLKKNLINKW